jgi:hypothetical protein
MRRRQCKWLWQRLKALQAQELTRDQLLLKLGAARQQASVAGRLKLELPAQPPPRIMGPGDPCARAAAGP